MFEVGPFGNRPYVRFWLHLYNACFFFLTWMKQERRVFLFGISLTLLDDDVKMLALDKS